MQILSSRHVSHATGPQVSFKPRAMDFTTILGEALTAIHKPTTPLIAIALYEDTIEPALGVGMNRDPEW